MGVENDLLFRIKSLRKCLHFGDGASTNKLFENRYSRVVLSTIK
jgi:hypothetical protein